MGKKQKEWARKKRRDLMLKLGGCCAVCGTEEDLTFDCIEPSGDAHHKYDTSQRMSFYRVQHAIKNLQILCETHQAEKSKSEQQYGVEEPF